MSKSANAGELRTPVYFKKIQRVTDADGYPSEQEINVFGEDKYVLTKWVNAHGSEVFTAMQLQIREPATITTRCSALIDEKCIVYKGSDSQPYEIISIDDVEERHIWLEIKVQRKEAAR